MGVLSGVTTNPTLLAASLRHPMHVVEAAKAGANIATLPSGVLRQMVHHPLTDAGLTRFVADREALRRTPAPAERAPAIAGA